MKLSSDWWRGPVAAGLVLFLIAPFAEAAAAVPERPISGQISSTETLPLDPMDQDQSGQPANSQSASDQSQNGTSKPVGTAAAPLEKGTGVAATRPAGAVIAPAKQRRARSILIRVGVVVGAAVAVGVVVGLSKASSSRPN
jgi:hypothetical protein